MDADSVVAALNELLTREQRSLAPRLFESTVFVSRLSVAHWRVAKSMVGAHRAHQAALTALIDELGGVPVMRSHDVMSADLHFQDIGRVMPRLIAGQETMVAAARDVLGRVASEPRAVESVASILTRYETELAALQRLLDAQAPSVAS
jgi:hypothetical protein